MDSVYTPPALRTNIAIVALADILSVAIPGHLMNRRILGNRSRSVFHWSSSNATEIGKIYHHSPHCTYSHRSARSELGFLEINCQTVRGICFRAGVRDNRSLFNWSKKLLVILPRDNARCTYDVFAILLSIRWSLLSSRREGGDRGKRKGFGQSIFMLIVYIRICIQNAPELSPFDRSARFSRTI